MTQSSAFEGAATVEQFGEYYETVRGHVREVLVRDYLLQTFPELSEPGKSVVDVGGGEAKDALWLAELGHTVTVVEPSSKMLVGARENLEQADGEVASRVTLVRSDAHAYAKERKPRFDFAFSHGVLMYLPPAEHAQHVHDLMDLTHEDGKISLLTRGWAATVERLVHAGDDAGLKRLADEGTYENNLAETTYPYRPAKLVRLFRKSGVHVLGWLGVRVVSDGDSRRLTDVAPDALNHIIEIEKSQGTDPHTKGMGQMLQLFASKQAPNLSRRPTNERGYVDAH